MRKSVTPTEETRRKISESLIGRFRGKDSPNWKGGLEHTRETKRICEARRRAIKRNAKGDFKKEEWSKLKEDCNFMCQLCGRLEPEIKLTIDHIIPLINGGAHCVDNIQPLCLSCNSSKKGRIWKEVKKSGMSG